MKYLQYVTYQLRYIDYIESCIASVTYLNCRDFHSMLFHCSKITSNSQHLPRNLQGRNRWSSLTLKFLRVTLHTSHCTKLHEKAHTYTQHCTTQWHIWRYTTLYHCTRAHAHMYIYSSVHEHDSLQQGKKKQGHENRPFSKIVSLQVQLWDESTIGHWATATLCWLIPIPNCSCWTAPSSARLHGWYWWLSSQRWSLAMQWWHNFR